MSESILILHTARFAASLNCSSGIPIASGIAPPYSLTILTYSCGTLDAPCKTIGNPGRRLDTSSRISSLNLGFCPGLNLYAPCDVPIAIARESTPVLVTKSKTSSGFVNCASYSETLTASSIPASFPSSPSTVIYLPRALTS